MEIGASYKQHLRSAVGGVDFRNPSYGDREAAVRAFTRESRRAFAEKVRPLWAAAESAAAAAAAGGGRTEGLAAVAAAGGSAEGHAVRCAAIIGSTHISLTVKTLQRLTQCNVPGYGEQAAESISSWLLLLCKVLRCCSPAGRAAYMKAEGGEVAVAADAVSVS